MARGVQRSPEERIQSLYNQIADLETKKSTIQSKISDTKNQILEIEREIKAKQLSELQNVLDSTGLTPEQLIALAKKQ